MEVMKGECYESQKAKVQELSSKKFCLVEVTNHMNHELYLLSSEIRWIKAMVAYTKPQKRKNEVKS